VTSDYQNGSKLIKDNFWKIINSKNLVSTTPKNYVSNKSLVNSVLHYDRMAEFTSARSAWCVEILKSRCKQTCRNQELTSSLFTERSNISHNKLLILKTSDLDDRHLSLGLSTKTYTDVI